MRGQGRQRDRDAHIGVTKGAFPARLDADLFVPASWAADRDRCERAGIPDGVGPRTTWRGAVDQWLRATGNGWSFDWLVLDAGYGAAVPFLRFLNLVHPPLVADVPVNVRVRDTADAPARRADARRSAPGARGGKRDRIGHWTVRASFWRATAATVWVADREHTLVAATNGATGEVQYSVTNAATTPLARVLAVVFRRWTVERAFRLGKQEAGVWITRAGTTPGWFGTWPWWCWGSWPPARAPAPAVTAVTAAPAEPAHGR